MNKHNILISCAGKRVALVRAFKETLCRLFPDAKVFTTDMNPTMAPAGYVSDHCFEVPRVTSPNYIDTLAEICSQYDIGMVIPTIDTELSILADNKALFLQQKTHAIVSDSSLIAICRDKRLTSDFFQSRGIRIPRPINKHQPIFPMFAKPYDGSLSSNLHYIQSPGELTEAILNDPKLVFMEYIDKRVYKEFTVDAYFGRDHCVKCIIPRERIEIRAGEINKGRSEKNILINTVREHLGNLPGCIGCICIQFFMNPRTSDVIGIEINPRFGGGYPLSEACGGRFPERLIREYFLGETFRYSDDWEDGKLMLRFDDAVFI